MFVRRQESGMQFQLRVGFIPVEIKRVLRGPEQRKQYKQRFNRVQTNRVIATNE